APTPFACGISLAATCTYLEAAIANGTTPSTWTPTTRAQWGCYGTDVMTTAQRTASLEIGQGRANTKMITDKPCAGTDDSLSAASIAKAYNGGGKDDWFLPSRKELNALCLSKYAGSGWWTQYQIDGCRGRQSAVTSAINVTPGWSFAADGYWSSSEYGAFNAWFQNFNFGTQDDNFKNATTYVRPVRAF
ncbi:MAG: DUF1566 domain-containing protein, partial [Actinobacteria bacterium]|nr:DUF1566 domain-containing protein [Actinomycetota bacterium]